MTTALMLIWLGFSPPVHKDLQLFESPTYSCPPAVNFTEVLK